MFSVFDWRFGLICRAIVTRPKYIYRSYRLGPVIITLETDSVMSPKCQQKTKVWIHLEVEKQLFCSMRK